MHAYIIRLNCWTCKDLLTKQYVNKIFALIHVLKLLSVLWITQNQLLLIKKNGQINILNEFFFYLYVLHSLVEFCMHLSSAVNDFFDFIQHTSLHNYI